jgi:hypothetical protein
MKLWHFVAVLVGGVVLVAGLGMMDRVNPEGVRGWVAGVDVSRNAEIPFFSHSCEVGPDMAKTDITDQWGCTFDIEFTSPAAADVTQDTHIDVWGDLAGLVEVQLHYIETFQDAGVWYNRFSVLAVVGGFGEIGDYATFVVPADGSMQSVSASLSVDAELRCTTDVDPIGADKAAATHAKEQTATDEWHIPTGQIGYATIGSATHSATLTEDSHPDSERLNLQVNLSVAEKTGDVVRLANIQFNGAKVDASELGPTALEPGVGTGTGELWVAGSGNTIRYYFEEASSASWGVGEIIHAPRHYRFAGLNIVDMNGTSIPTLEVWCPAVQVYDAAAEEWRPQKKTIADWQAAEYIDTWGYYSWDTDPPPDGAVRLLADVTFYIDADSGQAHNLDGFA